MEEMPRPLLPFLPPSSRVVQMLEWEARARAWLCSLAGCRCPSEAETEAWFDSERPPLPEDLGLLTPAELHQRIIGMHRDDADRMDGSRGRFRRAKHWSPVYSWLESLDTKEVVSGKDVKDWFLANPDIAENLSRNSRYHLLHYIQRVHMKILRRKGKFRRCQDSRQIPEGKDLRLFRKDEAFRRYELLTELQNQLESLLSKGSHVIDRIQSRSPAFATQRSVENVSSSVGDLEKENKGAISIGEPHFHNAENFLVAGRSELNAGPKRKRTKAVFTPAWSYCEVPSDSCWPLSTGKSATTSTKNITRCLQGREWGSSWVACCNGAYAGRNKEKWIPFFEGWNSLGRQFEGPSVLFERRSYSSWVPTWCAYTSSAAVAQPFGRTDQSVQKVLDVRFHPAKDSLNSYAPNELLLYNLLSGRAIQLSGHNCQIQAVEFAVRGASIVSCGGNLMKVWDATTGSCLFTLGPVSDGRASVGHTKKISAMTVNDYQSCLVVTSGGLGDGKLLLWNALTGELTADLNGSLRHKSKASPSIEAMEFCSQNLLVCGSDSSHGGPAVVQLWDIESPQSCLSIPANDSYITSLKTNSDCNTVITGAGDGAVDLYDIRTCGVISHLSVGSSYEVTSVSFSKCGTYFHASSTSNSTIVWDTRLMPMNRGHSNDEHSFSINNFTSTRPLHCLSHGKQMPTAEHAGQLPGHVDEGDQGVNDAKWLQRESVLVTVSGDGSIAMWDVALGKPCIRHLISHTRCVNTVAVAPNDEYISTGGMTRKLAFSAAQACLLICFSWQVLYHNTNGPPRARWRLSHPLAEAA
ncbi:unnamed protein product [Spirodela intermedia]|uniref:Uncharacterized protein n=1 Tax=Spirodela intermedia TaxID=51605 RepID=A0A7I8IQW3_SPIIN|nr:unnamed protein product [Spirodela intermedia]CAA6659926.1 unnamed protein product [Spirodela intermedia]